MVNNALELTGVCKRFGGVQAVDGVNLQVASDSVHGLIGPNGAGKTTLINLISGLLVHSNGRIALNGDDIGNSQAHKRAQRGIARTFQNLRIYPNLTVQQNIEVAASTVSGHFSHKGSDRIEEAMSQFDLIDKRYLYASELSYGHMRRLEIVRALALGPIVLMLDEPAAGMNQEETEQLIDGLQWVKDNHTCAMLIIDHDLRFIMSVCDRITVMNMGRVLITGTPSEVSGDPAVIAAYLGEQE
ncbi:MAG: ABC transporter ATP-binding protein [Granulosicoccus sp.]